MKNTKLFIRYFILFFTTLPLIAYSQVSFDQLIDEALAEKHRTPAYIERDKYRNPKDTLLFFNSLFRHKSITLD